MAEILHYSLQIRLYISVNKFEYIFFRTRPRALHNLYLSILIRVQSKSQVILLR